MRATVLVAGTDAIGVMIVAAILGVPFVFAIGVLVFIGAFVPMIGAFVSGTVAVLVALVAQGPITALLMLAGVVVVQQIEAHVLQPFLMGRFVSVHPLGVIVAIALGVIVAGIPGALIAVPCAAVAQRGRAAPRGGDRRGRHRPVRRRRTTRRHRPPRSRRRPPSVAAMSTTVPHVSLADIREARRLLEGVSVPTAMEDSRWLSAVVGGPVSLKCENLQRTGSFKIRGAYVRMLRLTEEERARGVVAASAGNHAQGVALAAQLLGIKATVFMPEGAPIPKLNATRGYGAEVVFHGAYLDHSLEEALRFADETGAVLIHPFDHEDIVAGQGTCGLEIMEQARTSRRC